MTKKIGVLFVLFCCLGNLAELAYAAPSRLISLNLKNVEIREVLSQLAREKGINLVMGEEVSGPVSVSLTKVGVDEALKAVLDAGGYQYVKEDNILRIIGSVGKDKGALTKDGKMIRAFTINYLEPKAVMDALVSVLPDVKVLAPDGAHTILVEDFPGNLKRIEKIIQRIDMAPKQVLVEAKVVEIDWSDKNTLGTNLTITTGNPKESIITQGFAKTAASSSDPGLYYSVTAGSFGVLLNALQTKSGYHLLASPRVIAVNGQPAEIISGSKLGYYLTTTTSTGTEQTVEFLEVGVKLNFTPRIGEDGSILMEIHPEVSDGAIAANGLPSKNTTEATTHLLVKDKDIIVIGGLLREKNEETLSAVPILGSIPVLGTPFRNKSMTLAKKEVIVLISPQIIRPEDVSTMFQGKAEEAQEKFEEFNPSIFW